jgi:hypothetical protein
MICVDIGDHESFSHHDANWWLPVISQVLLVDRLIRSRGKVEVKSACNCPSHNGSTVLELRRFP